MYHVSTQGVDECIIIIMSLFSLFFSNNLELIYLLTFSNNNNNNNNNNKLFVWIDQLWSLISSNSLDYLPYCVWIIHK